LAKVPKIKSIIHEGILNTKNAKNPAKGDENLRVVRAITILYNVGPGNDLHKFII
jgi:hypothetical protein